MTDRMDSTKSFTQPCTASARSVKIPPFYVMEILEKAGELEASGVDIVHLEIGEPDFPTPPQVVDAAVEALKSGKTKYTHSQGIPELRNAIAQYYQASYGIEVSPDNIVITGGTSPAMVLVFSALLNPGDGIILTNPCYACYPNIVEFVGGKPVYVEIKEEEEFKLNPERLHKVIKENESLVKGIIINSPSNPTGTVLEPADLKAIAEAAGDKWLISDEIYHGLVYEGRARSILEFTDRCFVLNGFSKLFAMTGWRLGYVICPPEFVRPIQKIQQNLFICASSFSQYAALSAIKDTSMETAEMVREYNRRRLLLIKGVRELGFGVAHEPKGAFYLFANAKRFTSDSYSFCLDVLRDAHVALTPGIDFGPAGEGYVRFSYANSTERIAEGLKRLKRYLGNLP